MLATELETEIKYNRDTRDFDLYIDGRYVGSAASYGEARYRLDAAVLDMLAHGDHRTATDLDGAQPSYA